LAEQTSKPAQDAQDEQLHPQEAYEKEDSDPNNYYTDGLIEFES
jgi:hypothetical protein